VRGLWCATLTPVGADGSLDEARMAGHARDLLAKGVEGVAPFGTTGEGPSFSVFERRSGLEALLRGGIAPRQIVVGTGCASLTDTLALTRHALENGVARCLVLPPFFYKNLSDDAVYALYATLIDRVADSRLRLYVYHIPQFSSVGIWPDTLRRLADAYPEVGTVLASYGIQAPTLAAVAAALLGEIPLTGRVPVTLRQPREAPRSTN